ncbi:DUF6531 domain-containing protein [Microbulbifer halophilus]|uniref:DUF6531 domain-containing protein n=1 Tax=Microbulbifer halophilus TaxID=453963 RepID=A0ABW5EAX9_9GAMM|nr:DUF6531 domain-containing protein [Microbulbifer halophilus]MCW8128131.1 DUF6531 domain-containing protein [Microbulbifer halophilus]
MTPDSLVEFIPLKLAEIHPPAIETRGGDPVALCNWVNRFSTQPPPSRPQTPLGDLWPRLPRIDANHYSLSQAPRPELLYTADCGPVIFCNNAGRNAAGDPLPAVENCQRVAGHVIACNGEVAFSRTDFVLPGPIPFHWQRHYRQGLAEGWRHSLDEHLQIDHGGEESEPGAFLHTADGRRIAFTLPAIGHSSYNRFERLLLHRQSLHSFRLLGFGTAAKIFRADGTGRSLPLTEIRDACGNTLTIDYQRGRPGRVVSSWGRALEFEYRGEALIRILDSQAAAGAPPLCEYEYDEDTALLATARGERTEEHYRYEAGQLADIADRGGAAVCFSRDARGRCHQILVNDLEYRLHWSRSQRLCRLDSPAGDSIRWTFNRRGQLLSEQQGDGERRCFYDHYGNLCQVTAADGHREIFRCDEFGRLLRRTCDGASDRYLYDSDGLLLAAQRRGEQNWRFHRDRAGLLREIVDPAGKTWRCAYDDRGLLEELADPEGGRVKFHWDGQAQLQALTRGERRWAFGYSHRNRLEELEIDGEVRGRWHYGERGELRSAEFGEALLELDCDDGDRPCRIRRDGQTLLQWQRDAAGSIRAITFADGRHWSLDYDIGGRLSQLQTESGAYRWHYDGCGRPAEFAGSDGFRRQWHYRCDGRVSEYRDGDTHWYLAYDSTGQLRRVRNNSGQQCEFHFDDHGRLIQAGNEHSHLRFRYDSRGLLVAEHCDGSDGDQLSVRHRYDDRGWLSRSASDSLDIACLFSPDGDLYGVDANGETAVRCERQGTEQIRHQGRARSRHQFHGGRLAAIEIADELRWQFPPAEPLDGRFPIPQPHPHAVEWDRRGNVAREIRPGARRREHRYQYDGWGLMTSAECGDFKTLFRYDPFGRRLAKITTHRRSSRRRCLLTLWTATGLWREATLVDDTRKATLHYLHHPVDGGPLARLRDDTLEHYVADADGALTAVIDDNGEPLWQRDGAPEPSAGRQRGPGNYRGSDGLFDGETGLLYRWRGYRYAGASLNQLPDLPPPARPAAESDGGDEDEIGTGMADKVYNPG